MQFNPIGSMFDISTYIWLNFGSILHVKKTSPMEQAKTEIQSVAEPPRTSPTSRPEWIRVSQIR